MQQTMTTLRKKYCTIYGCNNNSLDSDDVTFFKFPFNEYPRALWLDACHESGDIIQTTLRPYVCSRHFKPEQMRCFQDGKSKYLVQGYSTLPSLKLSPPPGYAEKGTSQLIPKENISQLEKQNHKNQDQVKLEKLLNDCVIEWIKRARHISPTILNQGIPSRHQLLRIGTQIRNLLGPDFALNINDDWIQNFQKTAFSDGIVDSEEKKPLDLVHIIKSIELEARIYNRQKMEFLSNYFIYKLIVKAKRRTFIPKKTVLQPVPAKLSIPVRTKASVPERAKVPIPVPEDDKSRFRQVVLHIKNNNIITRTEEELSRSQFLMNYFEFYGIEPTKDSGPEEKQKKDLKPKAASKSTVYDYQHALSHLKPLEDFVLRQGNVKALEFLTTLKEILKNPSIAKCSST